MQPDGVDLRPSFRFPSAVEIAGAAFGLVPFLVSTASMSSHTVNGEVTSFHYRDWTAIGGGAAAGICALASLALLARTDAAKRLPRIAVAVALAGLAAVQILRGVGMIGVDRAGSSTTTFQTEIIQSQRMEPPAPMPAVDVDTPTKALFEAWRAKRIEEIHAGAHPSLQKAAAVERFEDLHAQLAYGYGDFERVGPLAKSYENETFVLKGSAVYAKAPLDLTVEYQLLDGKPRLTYLNFAIPPSLQIKPTNEEAEATARKLLASMLAAKVDATLLDPELIEKLPKDIDAQLVGLTKKIGKVKKLGAVTAKDCTEGRCLDIEVVGAKSKAVFSTELAFQLVRWRARSFNLNLVK